MQRHPALRDLSVDHHHALVQAHRLKVAASGDGAMRRRAAEEFLAFWREHANPHFCEEEGALLPFFARYGEVDQEPINRMLREHALIRRDAARLRESRDAPDAALMTSLAEALEEHVRLEERVVFPLMEEQMPAEALAVFPSVLREFGQSRAAHEPESASENAA